MKKSFFVALILVATASMSAAHGAEGGHVFGTGSFTTSEGCVEVVSVHATTEGHEGQFLSYERRCAGLVEAAVEERPRCLVITGRSAIVTGESLVLHVFDRGLGSDLVSVRLSRRAPCAKEAARPAAAIGDFSVEGSAS